MGYLNDYSTCLPGLTHEAAWSWKITVGLGSTRKVMRIEPLSPCGFLSSVKLDQTISHGGNNISRGQALIAIPVIAYQASACNIFADVPLARRRRNGNPLQYSCLENPMDRGAWWAAVHRVAHSWTWLKWLSMLACFREGNGNPLQYSCLENPRDRGAWWAAVYEVTQNQTRWKWLSSSSSSSIGQRRSLAKLSVHVRGSYIRMWVLWDVIHWLLHPWGH